MRAVSLLGLARPALVLAAAVFVGACASDAAIDGRLEYWRAFLAREAPPGATAAAATAAMRRAGLDPQSGTYVVVKDDGSRVSNCRDPRAALSARETSAVRGLYSRYDIEVTVCLAADGRVEKHHVAAWHQGL